MRSPKKRTAFSIENMANIKFWNKFKTISEFQQIKNRKRCWNKCNECKESWDDIETDHVHMLNFKNPEDFVNGNGTFFVCDNCKSKIQLT